MKDFKNKTLYLNTSEIKTFTPSEKETKLLGETLSDEDVIYIEGWANKYVTDGGDVLVDHSSESVLPSAYDFTMFEKNPILLYQHDHYSPIGKILYYEAKPEGLLIKAAVFRKMSEKAFTGIKQNILRTFSIGFLVQDWVYNENIDAVMFTNVKLLEVSVVSVPDNYGSTFITLQESPCGNGQCMLSVKDDMISKQYKKPTWKDIDKKELKIKLKEENDKNLINEEYLLIRNEEGKFPHHFYNEETKTLEFSKEGFVSALSAFKSALVDNLYSIEDYQEGFEHIKKHIEEEYNTEDEIPDIYFNIQELVKDKLLQNLQKEQNSGEGGAESNTGENSHGEESNKDEGSFTETDDKVGITQEVVIEYFKELANEEEGLDTLLMAYEELGSLIDSVALGETEQNKE